MTSIANLLNCDERSRSLLIDEGGLDIILEAFKNTKNKPLQKCGLRCILNLVPNLETRALLCADLEFLPILVRMGLRHNGDQNIMYMTAACIDVITRKKDFAIKVLNTDSCLDCLMGLAGPRIPDEVVAEAVRALLNIISIDTPEIRDKILSAGVIDCLKCIITDKPIEVRYPAEDALALLTNDQDKIKKLETKYGLDFSYGVADPEKEEL